MRFSWRSSTHLTRRAGAARGGAHQRLLARDHALLPEAAADVGGDDAQRGARACASSCGDRRAHEVRHLRRGPQRRGAGRGRPTRPGTRAPRAAARSAAPEAKDSSSTRWARSSRSRRARGRRGSRRRAARCRSSCTRGASSASAASIEATASSTLVLDGDALGAVLGRVRRVGEDDGDGLADVADALAGQQRHLDRDELGAVQARHQRASVAEVVGGEHRAHAVGVARGRRCRRPRSAPTPYGDAHERGVEQPRRGGCRRRTTPCRVRWRGSSTRRSGRPTQRPPSATVAASAGGSAPSARHGRRVRRRCGARPRRARGARARRSARGGTPRCRGRPRTGSTAPAAARPASANASSAGRRAVERLLGRLDAQRHLVDAADDDARVGRCGRRRGRQRDRRGHDREVAVAAGELLQRGVRPRAREAHLDEQLAGLERRREEAQEEVARRDLALAARPARRRSSRRAAPRACTTPRRGRRARPSRRTSRACGSGSGRPSAPRAAAARSR